MLKNPKLLKHKSYSVSSWHWLLLWNMMGFSGASIGKTSVERPWLEQRWFDDPTPVQLKAIRGWFVVFRAA
jgi:hypothetical protein